MRITDPGQFRTKLVYQERTYVKDSFGDPVETWTAVATVFARLAPLSGRELYYARQTHAQTTHRIECRYHPAVKPSGRFVVANTTRTLHVLGVLDDESRRVQLTILCVETDQPTHE